MVRDATSSVTIFKEFIKVAVDSNFKQIVSLKDENTQLHSDIKNLEKDRDNSKQLAMKAIAARSNIKQYLDEEKNRNGQL